MRIQLNLRYAANTEPLFLRLFLHWRSRLLIKYLVVACQLPCKILCGEGTGPDVQMCTCVRVIIPSKERYAQGEMKKWGTHSGRGTLRISRPLRGARFRVLKMASFTQAH